MKGHDLLTRYKVENPEVHILEVHKGQFQQPQLAEFMSACDFMVVTNRLRPWSMAEWEGMASGLELLDLADQEREFTDWSRKKVFELGWDRATAKETWMDYLC